ncbi:MAG: T9SS type A sorting domain-containing protein [Aureispira sp.]
MRTFTMNILGAFCSLFFFLIGLNPLAAQNFPIDFETGGNGASWNWTTFENDTNPTLEIIANPDMSGINTSATVAKFTALQTGQPFAGCETLHGAGTGTYTIDSSNMIVRIMVWKNTISDVGVKLVRVDGWSLGEIKIPNTVTGQWEQLEFDFSAHMGNTYDQLVVFPDFTPRTSDNVVYFDNVFGDTASTVMNSTRTIAGQTTSIDVFPNPTAGLIQVQSEDLNDGTIVLLDLLGRTIQTQNITADLMSIEIDAKCEDGLYLLQVMDDKGRLVETKKISYSK